VDLVPRALLYLTLRETLAGPVLGGLVLGAVVAMVTLADAAKKPRRCPAEMASIEGRYCVDRHEAHLVELEARRERPHSPFAPVGDRKVRARSARSRVPQAYVTRDEAERACAAAGKRLCSDDEWVGACKGRRPTLFPYGDAWQPGRCNDRGESPFNRLFGAGKEAPESAYTFDNLNDPRLNQLPRTLAATGKFARCRNAYGLFDMVGNLHEWTADPRGTFRGGYYLDVHKNGAGCDYRTVAHGPKYRDYSIGFRCCKTL
jgi:formylglycine-generating enzyme required for sulfatase activity